MIYYMGVEMPSKNTAGAKAPADIMSLCQKRGYQYIPLCAPNARVKNQKIRKFLSLIEGERFWRKIDKTLRKGDILIYQHPSFGWLSGEKKITRLKKRGVKFIALIHDLESLRKGISGIVATNQKTSDRKDGAFLRQFNIVICHNEKMKQYLLSQGFSEKQLVKLEIFDYLTETPNIEHSNDRKQSVNIAGNLAKAKCGYIYDIANQDHMSCIKIHLYGINFNQDIQNKNLVYHGSFKPEELPSVMEGGFGVVWDGESAETCKGNTGEYLKFNNPHKTSLYLASEIPIIIWKQAALAGFIEENKLGLTVNSLYDVENSIRNMTDDEYSLICENTKRVAERIRTGYYFYSSLDEALDRLK